MQTIEHMGLYLYGIVRSGPMSLSLRAQGARPEEGIQLLAHNRVAAIVKRVDLEEFAPKRVQGALQTGETGWIEEKALAHATVLQEMMQLGPVVPARFGILFRDRDHLGDVLAAQEGDLLELLDYLDGRVEWGVKGFCTDETAKEALARLDPEVIAVRERLKGSSQGLAYMHRKKEELLLKEKLQKYLPEWADEVHAKLSSVSDAAIALKPATTGQATEGERVFLNGAYLVRTDATNAFQEQLACLGDVWKSWDLRFDLSGPWPAHHFSTLTLEGGDR